MEDILRGVVLVLKRAGLLDGENGKRLACSRMCCWNFGTSQVKVDLGLRCETAQARKIPPSRHPESSPPRSVASISRFGPGRSRYQGQNGGSVG